MARSSGNARASGDKARNLETAIEIATEHDRILATASARQGSGGTGNLRLGQGFLSVRKAGLNMAWTQEREDLLRKLWLQGLSASQIAYVMAGITRNAVIGKAHRMGLPKRSPATSHRPKPRVQRGKPSLALVGARPAPRESIMEKQFQRGLGLALETGFQAEQGDRVTLMTLTSRTCKWPIGDPADADFHFCSHEAENGRSYCEFHHGLAYQGIRRRRPAAERAAAPIQVLPLRAIAV